VSVRVCPLHRYFREEHLAQVKVEMQKRGSPTLRGYFDVESNTWFMSEGTHRLRAAKALDIAPTLVHIPWWRTRKSLERARHVKHFHVFERVECEVSA